MKMTFPFWFGVLFGIPIGIIVTCVYLIKCWYSIEPGYLHNPNAKKFLNKIIEENKDK